MFVLPYLNIIKNNQIKNNQIIILYNVELMGGSVQSILEQLNEDDYLDINRVGILVSCNPGGYLHI